MRTYDVAHRDEKAAYNKAYREAHKASMAAKDKAYYESHKAEIAAYQAIYKGFHKTQMAARDKAYRAANREEALARDRAYYKAHRAERAAYRKAYYEAHKAKHLAKHQEWVEANRDRANEHWDRSHQKRKRLLKGRRCDLTLAEWQAIKESQNHRCAMCGEAKPLTRDHIIPLSKGGDHTASNIQGLCQRCNSSKGIRTLDLRQAAIPVQLQLWEA